MKTIKSLLGVFLLIGIVIFVGTISDRNKNSPISNEKTENPIKNYSEENSSPIKSIFKEEENPIPFSDSREEGNAFKESSNKKNHDIKGSSEAIIEDEIDFLIRKAFDKNLTSRERASEIRIISHKLENTYNEEDQIRILKKIAEYPSKDAFFIIESVMGPSHKNPNLSKNSIHSIRYLEDEFFLSLLKEKFLGSQVMNDTSGYYQLETINMWKNIHLATGDALSNMAIRGSIDPFLELLEYEVSLNSPVIPWIKNAIDKNPELDIYIEKMLEDGNIKIHDDFTKSELLNVIQ